MSLKRVADIETEEDMRFQERAWLLERIGWLIMALLVSAALAGLFGNGWLSNRTVTASGGALQVEYNRFARYMAPATLRVRFMPASGQREIRMGVSTAFLDAVRIERITPEPNSVQTQPDHVIYLFSVADVGQPTSVTVHLKMQRIGRVPARISLPEGPSVSFNHFVYP